MAYGVRWNSCTTLAARRHFNVRIAIHVKCIITVLQKQTAGTKLAGWFALIQGSGSNINILALLQSRFDISQALISLELTDRCTFRQMRKIKAGRTKQLELEHDSGSRCIQFLILESCFPKLFYWTVWLTSFLILMLLTTARPDYQFMNQVSPFISFSPV